MNPQTTILDNGWLAVKGVHGLYEVGPEINGTFAAIGIGPDLESAIQMAERVSREAMLKMVTP